MSNGRFHVPHDLCSSALTVITRTASHEDALAFMKRLQLEYYYGVRTGGWSIRKSTSVGVVPACETESPASSINWSIEKAPVVMSSWSSEAALLAEIVFIL